MLVCFCKAPEKQHSLLASGACDYTHANVYHSRWHFLILKLKPSTYREHVMYWGNVIIIHSTRSMFMLAFFFFFTVVYGHGLVLSRTVILFSGLAKLLTSDNMILLARRKKNKKPNTILKIQTNYFCVSYSKSSCFSVIIYYHLILFVEVEAYLQKLKLKLLFPHVLQNPEKSAQKCS